MSAVWPLGLPQAPDTDGFTETPPNNLLRTQMDVGPAKVRRRFTAGVRGFSMQMVLTRTEVDTLESFFYQTLVGGSLVFDWVNPRTETATTFRFTAPPTYSPDEDGQSVVVSMQLEELP